MAVQAATTVSLQRGDGAPTMLPVIVNRIAIGYSPKPDEVDRPTVVFIEVDTGVWMQVRGEPAPQVIDGPIDADDQRRVVKPGDAAYFDVILDSFSTRWLIRTVMPEAGVMASMLASERIWEVLPGPGATVPA